jgi:hypothetical protein
VPVPRARRRKATAQIERRLPERALAWIVTGPLGHLYSVLADLAVFLAREVAARARRRLLR